MADVADPIAHFRERPGMYIGGTGPRGLLHMVVEIAANSFDQALAGSADAITVAVERGGILSVSDNGAGISTSVESGGRTFLERVCTEFHNTPTADGHRPHLHLGARGLGIFVVCALSEFLEVQTSDGTRVVRQTFAAGKATSPLEVVDQDGQIPSGTTVRFRPDREIFGSQSFPIGKLEAELSTLTSLVPGVSLTISIDQTYGPSKDLRDLHEVTWPSEQATERPSLVEHASPAGRASLAFRFARGGSGSHVRIRSFCNHFETSEGGSHVLGIEEGLNRVFGTAAAAIMDQLSVVLHVTLDDPEFVGPTRGQLDSPEAIALVADALAEHLPGILAADPELDAQLRALASEPPA